MAPTLASSTFLQQNTTAATALVTGGITVNNGDVIVVKFGTWSTTTAMGAPVTSGQTYTSRVINAPGAFNEWCGIYTAVITGSPGTITVSSTPAASARYSMTVERWTGAQLAATPVTNSLAGSGTAASTITPAQATSVISWCSGDAGSIDPATRTYLASGSDEGVRDGHSGANGVEYYGWQNAVSTSSQSYGLSLPAGQTFVIAGIEIQASGGAAATATAQPIVVTRPSPRADALTVLARNTAALITPAARAVPLLVVRSDARAPAPYAALLRNDLADPPVPTTPSPLVISRTGAVPAPYAALSRSSLADVTVPATSTPQPYVITARYPLGGVPSAFLLFNPAVPVPSVQPYVIAGPAAPLPRASTVLLGNPAAAPVIAAAYSAQPYVVPAVTAPSPASTLLLRGTLTDPVTLTTPGPIVVRSDAVAGRPIAALLRNALVPFVAPNDTPAPHLFVITRPGIVASPLVILFGTSQLGGPFVPPPVPPTPTPVQQGSWWSLVSVLREGRAEARFTEPKTCPNDGEPLRLSADGIWYCAFDNYVLGDRPVQRHVGGQDWGGLGGVIDTVIADATADRGRRTLSCPHDGEPLSVSKDGVAYCRYDGWRPDGGTMPLDPGQ